MDTPSTVKKLIEESRAFEQVGELAAAIKWAQQALNLAKSLEDAAGAASAYLALAYSHIRLGHYPEVIRLCQVVLSLTGPDNLRRAEALLELGICACETNDMSTADAYFQYAIDLSRQIGAHETLVRGLHDISAGIYMLRGQFSLSLAADEEVRRRSPA